MDDIVKLQGKKIENINPDSQFLKSKQNIAIWREKLSFFYLVKMNHLIRYASFVITSTLKLSKLWIQVGVQMMGIFF